MTVLLIDDPASGVRRMRIDRPNARNAIDAAVRAALRSALSDAAADPDVRVILFGSANGVFCAGGDLPSMVSLSEADADIRMRESHGIAATIGNFPKPVVAAVEKFAIGAGAGMALLADHLIMADDAFLSFPFLKIGLVPDWGITATLPLRTGIARAARVLRSGGTILAAQAVDTGVADEMAPADQIESIAIDRATALGALPAAAFARLKIRLRGQELQATLDAERIAQVQSLIGPEFREGYAAFLEKRSADFRKPA